MPNYIVIHMELQIKSYIKGKWINQNEWYHARLFESVNKLDPPKTFKL